MCVLLVLCLGAVRAPSLCAEKLPAASGAAPLSQEAALHAGILLGLPSGVPQVAPRSAENLPQPGRAALRVASALHTAEGGHAGRGLGLPGALRTRCLRRAAQGRDAAVLRRYTQVKQPLYGDDFRHLAAAEAFAAASAL